MHSDGVCIIRHMFPNRTPEGACEIGQKDPEDASCLEGLPHPRKEQWELRRTVALFDV